MSLLLRLATQNDQPLTWEPIGRPSGALAVVYCGKGHPGTLHSNSHVVAPDGTVSPSLVCGWDGCDWHEFVRLERWGNPWTQAGGAHPGGKCRTQ